jgi:V8-like Glu-specific endopeptidase
VIHPRVTLPAPLRAAREQRTPPPSAAEDAPAASSVHEATPPDLFVRCADRTSCPDAVGMLVTRGAAGEQAERCTATLVAPNRALTASHCLTPNDRHAGSRCDGTWLAFPETADAPAAWIACSRVLAAVVVNEDALHQDHALIELAQSSTRVPLVIDDTPPEVDSIVTVVSVTPHPVYGTTHELATRLCRAVDSQEALHALGAGAANVGWLASCPIEHGNSGSPVLDHEGRIRAIVHGGTATTFERGVTSAPAN